MKNTLKLTQSGQILLITLLVLSVATTIVLSLIGRATTDVAITSQIEDSTRAFNAAEAGIEEVLKTGVGIDTPQTLTTGLTYTAPITAIGNVNGVYKLPRITSQGETETIWMVPHNADNSVNDASAFYTNNLDICWSHNTPKPALVVTIFYKSAGVYKVARAAYDPVQSPTGTRADNSFDRDFTSVAADDLQDGCGQTNSVYAKRIRFETDFGIDITPPTSDIITEIRLKPVYSETQFYLSTLGGGTLPEQGKNIVSTGVTASGTTRKIVVTQQYRTASPVFDYAVFSEQSFGR